ncbi:hypothetical protein [Streptomyces sp. NPDC046985]
MPDARTPAPLAPPPTPPVPLSALLAREDLDAPDVRRKLWFALRRS